MSGLDTAGNDPTLDEPSVAFRPISPLRAHEYVAEQLRHHIALGLVPVGRSLPPERDLARMFQVGRPTIQAALKVLESEHLIETRRGRGGGAFVIEPTRDHAGHERLLLELRLMADAIEDSIRFRRILEEGAAAEAARRADKDGVDSLVRIAQRMTGTIDPRAFHNLDTEFHIRIAEMSGIAQLRTAVEQVRIALNEAILAQPASPAWHDRINGEHHEIIDAIAGHDPSRAVRVMSTHLSRTEAGVRSLIASVTDVPRAQRAKKSP